VQIGLHEGGNLLGHLHGVRETDDVLKRVCLVFEIEPCRIHSTFLNPIKPVDKSQIKILSFVQKRLKN
jgi:hypothetical protein